MMAGHLNGSGRKSGDDDKIASLDEARRRAAARAKEEARRSSSVPRPGGAMTARDWLVGAVVMAMALGMIWHWLAPLVGAKGLVR
jgi:hypothetical protein